MDLRQSDSGRRIIRIEGLGSPERVCGLRQPVHSHVRAAHTDVGLRVLGVELAHLFEGLYRALEVPASEPFYPVAEKLLLLRYAVAVEHFELAASPGGA